MFSGQLFNPLALILGRLCPTGLSPGCECSAFWAEPWSPWTLSGLHPISKRHPQPCHNFCFPHSHRLCSKHYLLSELPAAGSAHTSPQRGRLQRPHLMVGGPLPRLLFITSPCSIISPDFIIPEMLPYIHSLVSFSVVCLSSSEGGTLLALSTLASCGLEKCLLHGRESVNVCWKTNWINKWTDEFLSLFLPGSRSSTFNPVMLPCEPH